MDIKSSLIIGVCIIVASAVLGLTVSLRPLASPEPPGRFQMTGFIGHAYILDTATGQVWQVFAPEGSFSSNSEFEAPKLKGKQ